MKILPLPLSMSVLKFFVQVYFGLITGPCFASSQRFASCNIDLTAGIVANKMHSETKTILKKRKINIHGSHPVVALSIGESHLLWRAKKMLNFCMLTMSSSFNSLQMKLELSATLPFGKCGAKSTPYRSQEKHMDHHGSIMGHRRPFCGKPLGDPTPDCLQQQTYWILHGCLCSGFVNDQGKGGEGNPRFCLANGKDENMFLLPCPNFAASKT